MAGYAFGQPQYGLTRTLQGADLDEVKTRVIEALADQGFGVLNEIDLRTTLKNKLDVDVDPYIILGACNPRYAHMALGGEPGIGLLLPCNVVVAQGTDGVVVSAYRQMGDGTPAPERTVAMELVSGLRYGENPHQGAAFYRDLSLSEDGAGGLATATQHHGKEMSYNNYLDSEAAYATVMDLPSPGCVVVKHTNPCGAAEAGEGAAAGGPEQLEAYRQAVRADPVSAFGGVVAFNHEITAELAREIREFRSPTDGETRMFYEIVVAPSYTPEGLEVLKGKSKNLRILEAPPRTSPGVGLRQVGGGWLMQEPDSLVAADIDFVTVSEAQPSPEQLADLRLAWTLVKHVKSNAIAIAKGNSLLGMGSGQPNRVKSVEIALEKAGDAVQGAAMASDAFFPFSWGDSVEKACEAGVKIIAHPGGSIRDQDAIDCCNKYGVVLCTTGVRHFRH